MPKTNLTAIAVPALLILLVVGVQIVNLAKANPFFPSGSHSDEPLSPQISLKSLEQDLPYSSESNVWLNFTVTVPLTSWYRSDGSKIGTTFGSITSVECILDGLGRSLTANSTYHEYRYFLIDLGSLPYGLHTLKIDVEGRGYIRTTLTYDYYTGSSHSFVEDVPTKLVSNFTQVNFTVNEASGTNILSQNSSAPSSSSITPIVSPTDQLTPSLAPSSRPSFTPTNITPSPSVPEFPTGAVLLLFITAITALVYFILKKDNSQKQLAVT